MTVKNFTNKYLILLIGLIFIIIFFINFSLDGYMEYQEDRIPIIAGDGVGYYDHLPFYVIRQGFSLDKILSESSLSQYWNKYNIGEALMIAPLFFIAHLLSYIFNYPTDGYSAMYQYAAGLAGLFYALWGLEYLKKILDEYFSANVVFLTLISIIFGTNLLYYSTIASTMSHVFSFFLVSILLFFTPKWYRLPNVKNTIILAIVSGFLILVRLNNIVFLLIPLLYDLKSSEDIKPRLFFLKDNLGKIVISVLIIFIIFIPQLITWKLTYNAWFVFTYGQEKLNFLAPKIAQVLFSLRRGLFFWSPVLILTIIGFPIIKKKAREYFIAWFLFFPLYIYMNSSLGRWWFGASFGHRAFIESFPLLAIPLALFFDSLDNKKVKIFAIVITSILIIYSLIQMYLYRFGLIPPDEITIFSYQNLFLG